MSIQPLNDILDATETIMFLNGFLQENDDQFIDWLVPQLQIAPNIMIYGVNWPSQTVSDLGILAKELWQNRNVWQLINNPWHKALQVAEQSGYQLGQLLMKGQYHNLTIVGHSLGCRVIFYALETLAKKHHPLSANIILLGGAVGNQTKDWDKTSEYIHGNIYNCFSKEDNILQHIYRSSLAWFSQPIGRYPIENDNEKIINVDCTEIVKSHLNWKQKYQDIYHTIFNNN